MSHAVRWLPVLLSSSAAIAAAACFGGQHRITEPVGVDNPNRVVSAPNPSVEATPTVNEELIPVEVQDRAEQRCRNAALVSPHFDLNSIEVRPQDNAEVRALAGCLSDGPLAGYPVVLVGHADGSGNEVVDEKLARARAEQVMRFLVARGVARAQIRIRATVDAPTPKNEPAFRGDESVGWSKRRVDVFVTEPAAPKP